MLHSSVDIALTRDYLDETKAGDKETRRMSCRIGRRKQGRHLLHSSVDRAFTRDCRDGTKETSQAFAS